MTLAVQIPKIDAALYQRYSDIILNGAAVRVFIEEPDTDRYRERVYPSISIKLISMVPAFELLESGYDEDEEVSLDITDPLHPVRTMRRGPEPYRLLYSVDTWNRPFAADARDLLMITMVSRTPIRSALETENIEGEWINLFMLAEGTVASNDVVGADEVIYHKTRSVEISAWLDMSISQSQTTHRATGGLQFDVFGFRPLIPDPLSVPMPPKNLDISFIITDDGVEVL